MTPDREETLLRRALQEGVHPAETDLWPAVAEALPAGQKRYNRRIWALRLVVCIGAPLLLAAGALLGRVQFTNLRTDPRPSFAPDKNTGYAIRYDQTAYALPDELMDSLMAHYNGQTDADGVPPMSAAFSGINTPDARGPGSRGYSSWADLTEATGLPLLQNTLLDSGIPDDSIYLSPNPSSNLTLPEDWDEQTMEEHNAFYKAYYDDLWRFARYWPVGFTLSWADTSDITDAPQYLFAHRTDVLDNGFTVETKAQVALATVDRPAGTVATEHQLYFDKSAGFVWDVEEHTTPSGMVALLPICTSNRISYPWLSCYAYFEKDGIYYCLTAYGDGSLEAARAVLKEVLDSFTPAA